MSWGLVAVAGATLVGGVMASESAGDQADAAKESARIGAEASDRANALNREMWETSREDAKPLREVYGPSVYSLADLAGAGGPRPDGWQKNTFNFQSDPGTQFRIAEGEKAINRAAAARGGFNSGATLKALTKYNSDLASQDYNTAADRNWNRLASLAGLAQVSSNNQAALGQSYANQIGNNILGGANANAAGVVGASNARASGWGNMANSLSGLAKADWGKFGNNGSNGFDDFYQQNDNDVLMDLDGGNGYTGGDNFGGF